MQTYTRENLMADNALRCLIVEDEANQSNYLKRLLEKTCPEVKVMAEARSVQDTIRLLKKSEYQFDVVFLDIHLSDGLAFEVIPDIKEQDIDFVFCTAYLEHSIEAWKVNATHYLLKPIEPDLLRESIDRVIAQRLAKSFSEEPADTILSVRDNTKIYFIPHREINYCRGDNSYTEIHLINGKKITISKTLKYIVELLPTNQQFYRIHKSHSVNLNKVDFLKTKEPAYVVMKNGERLKVARRRLPKFRNYLNRWKLRNAT